MGTMLRNGIKSKYTNSLYLLSLNSLLLNHPVYDLRYLTASWIFPMKILTSQSINNAIILSRESEYTHWFFFKKCAHEKRCEFWSALQQITPSNNQMRDNAIHTRDHLLSTYAKFPENLKFLKPWYAHLRVCIRG